MKTYCARSYRPGTGHYLRHACTGGTHCKGKCDGHNKTLRRVQLVSRKGELINPRDIYKQ